MAPETKFFFIDKITEMLGSMGLWAILFFILILILFIFILVRYAKKRKYIFIPYGKITSPQIISLLLNQALDQFRPFEMQIGSKEDRKRPTLKCVPLTMGKNNISLGLVGLRKNIDRWLNQPVTIYFNLESKGEFSYHIFNSTIKKIEKREKDSYNITLALPESIGNRQQRSFLRISPPENLLCGASLWYGDTEPQLNFMSDLSSWSRPVLFCIPNTVKQFDIADLSAGGMRLLFSRDVVDKMGLKLTTLDRFIVMLDLYDPEDFSLVRLWIQCRSQRVTVESSTQNVYLGAKFLNWAKPKNPEDPNKPGAIEWFKLSSAEEISPLSYWIMRHHLAEFNEEDDDINEPKTLDEREEIVHAGSGLV